MTDAERLAAIEEALQEGYEKVKATPVAKGSLATVSFIMACTLENIEELLP